jgi:hypothetical protein
LTLGSGDSDWLAERPTATPSYACGYGLIDLFPHGGFVAGVTHGASAPREVQLTAEEENALLSAADIVTLARTAVETDYSGRVIDAHEPEMPTRFVKQLVQIFRGALAIGMRRTEALALVLRCAHDSVPPLRLAVLLDVDENDLDDCRVTDVAKRLNKPWTTIDRVLQTLHVLRLLDCVEYKREGEDKKTYHYSIATGVCLDPLKPSPEM